MHTGARVVRNARIVMPSARESAQDDSQHCGMLRPGFSADLKKVFSHHFSNIFCIFRTFLQAVVLVNVYNIMYGSKLGTICM